MTFVAGGALKPISGRLSHENLSMKRCVSHAPLRLISFARGQQLWAHTWQLVVCTSHHADASAAMGSVNSW